jgi:collagen type VII alpha
MGPVGPPGPAGPAGLRGPVGHPGPPGLAFKGAWMPGTAYATNDAVTHDGEAWLALQDSRGMVPSATADKAWARLSGRGAMGPAGSAGPAGPPGPQDPEGPAGALGPTGSAGPVGSPGPLGPVGPPGPVGPEGLVGPHGPQGLLGPRGPAGMTFQGRWSATAAYGERDLVLHRGEPWLALQASTGVEPTPIAAREWARLGVRGESGPPGPKGDPGPSGPVGMLFRGAWDRAVAYLPRDVVVHSGETWLAVETSSGMEPAPTAASQWARLMARGDPGPVGPKGETGARGPEGLPGITTIIGGGMGTGGALSTTSPTYLGLFVSSAYFTGAPTEAAQVMPVGGVLSSLHVRLRSEASTGLGSYTFTVLRDTSGTGDSFAPTSLTCTVSGSALGCSDVQHSETFGAGDLVVVRASPQGAVLGVQMQWTARFAPRRP